MAVATFADVRALCESHAAEPLLRTETRDGRVYVSLSAIQSRTPNTRLYDLRSDYAWDDFPQAVALLDQAMSEWWQ